jgi:hypothetical protein
MTEDEVIEIVQGAIEQTENQADVKRARVKMALWLWGKFKIAVKELGLSFKDGLPYLKVEYTNEEGETVETRVSMAKYADKLTAELSKFGEKMKTPGA